MDLIKDLLKTLHKEFGWLIWGLVALGVIWFFRGGVDSQFAHEGAFLKPPAPLDSGQAYGTYYAGVPSKPQETLNLPQAPADIITRATDIVASLLERSKQATAIHTTALAANGVSFDGVAGAESSDPTTEYLRIIASIKAVQPIDISNMLLKGTGQTTGIPIPRAVNLPLIGYPEAQADVYLPPGARALITTGPSPVGYSFHVNECSGYLAQSYAFTPDLERNCPDPKSELAAAGLGGDATCAVIVNAMPACTAHTGALPTNISNACKTFLTERLTYNGCITNHLNDKGFYSGEWRLFLGQNAPLWKNSGEIIGLIDQKGRIIDELAY
ncbi:MAG: hypothetical protein KGI79_02530 [Patescibacteria group bacterium]|nr:hypothetical protein [Patescibacteria group bacterium]MDE2116727.1 hypothetical protein [Patescibacteria group bacterium]